MSWYQDPIVNNDRQRPEFPGTGQVSDGFATLAPSDQFKKFLPGLTGNDVVASRNQLGRTEL